MKGVSQLKESPAVTSSRLPQNSITNIECIFTHTNCTVHVGDGIIPNTNDHRQSLFTVAKKDHLCGPMEIRLREKIDNYHEPMDGRPTVASFALILHHGIGLVRSK